MENKTSHIIVLLGMLLDGKSLTASDYIASNSNQYFRSIKKQGIELIEVWENNRFNTGKHKIRRLNQSLENIKRAENHLKRLKGKIWLKELLKFKKIPLIFKYIIVPYNATVKTIYKLVALSQRALRIATQIGLRIQPLNV